MVAKLLLRIPRDDAGGVSKPLTRMPSIMFSFRRLEPTVLRIDSIWVTKTLMILFYRSMFHLSSNASASVCQ